MLARNRIVFFEGKFVSGILRIFLCVIRTMSGELTHQTNQLSLRVLLCHSSLLKLLLQTSANYSKKIRRWLGSIRNPVAPLVFLISLPSVFKLAAELFDHASGGNVVVIASDKHPFDIKLMCLVET